MDKTKKCRNCGTGVPMNAPFGHCPQCLIALGFGPLPEEIGVLSRKKERQPASESIHYFGDYELIEKIAQGGMGMVYKARQTTLNRLVAIKLISAGALATPELVKRFKAEAEAAASLSHPNIVPIYEIGEHKGQHYFSMALIEGPNLREALGKTNNPKGEPQKASERLGDGWHEPRNAAQLLSTIARAVHYAHQRGVLHRDIKPSNILLDPNGAPHLTDFGLAKLVEKESTLTQTNAIMGTPAYMSPEQARGETKDVTTAADVYGLGAVLYETLTGSPPFSGGTSMETIRQVLEQEPRRPSLWNPEVDRDLETICLKCLEKEPHQRYASGEALAEDLDRWLGHEPIEARASTPFEHLRKWVRRRPAVATLAGGLTLAFVVGLVGVMWQWRRAQDARNLAENNARTLRQNLYAADMGLAFRAWESDRPQRARQLIEDWRPVSPKVSDLRGFEWRYLYGLTRPNEEFVFNATPGVWGSAVSPDNHFLGLGSSDGHLVLWDLEQRRRATTFNLPEGVIYSVAISPDSGTLANTMASSVADANGLIYLWDLHHFGLKRTLRGHKTMTTGVAFSPDRKLLASVTGWPYNPKEVGQIFLWDVDSGTKQAELQGHNTSVGFGISFSADGKLLATPHGDGLIRIWDVQSQAIVQTLKGHNGLVFAVNFSPDGKQLGSGGVDGAVRLWQLGSNPTTEIIGRHDGPVFCVAFSPNGKRLVSGGRDTTARLWDLEHREEMERFRGHSDRVCSVSFAANGSQILTGSSDGSGRLWRADAAKSSSSEVFPYPGAGACLISPDSRWILWNSRFWKLDGMTNVSKINGGLWSFSPDGKNFVTRGSGPGFEVWDVADGAPRRFRIVTTRTNLSAIWPSFSPDGKKVSLISGRTNAVVWSTSSWLEVGSVHEEGLAITAQAFSPDGKWLTTAYKDGRVRLWRSKDLSKDRLLTGHRLEVRNLAFSKDGRFLATAGMDNAVRLWEMFSGECHELRGDSGWMDSVAFSPDGRTLAAGTLNGEIKFWNIATLREIMTLKGHTTAVGAVAFSPNGRLLVSAGGETLRVWRSPSFEESDATK